MEITFTVQGLARVHVLDQTYEAGEHVVEIEDDTLVTALMDTHNAKVGLTITAGCDPTTARSAQQEEPPEFPAKVPDADAEARVAGLGEEENN